MSVVALVGNPREGSRTLTVAVEAARAVGRRLERAGHGFGRGADGAEPYEVVDLAALGPHLLAPGASPQVEVALELVREASVLVVASPTYKGTYTGLLKAFLDRLPPQALAGKAALPLLVMGDAKHALAVEVHLRPLLVELGATVPTPGLAVLESQLPSLEEVITPWADRVAPQAAAGAGLTRAAGGGGVAEPAVVTSG
ncbi:FMN reductase [[Actinomadura] parvosata subsp. kistnae]|uniref:FMN reductase n=1 Tax=[Actinomadura] parvosata subsp. kistnae TaxID=1909395 RepID=A0A1V0A5B0_9ACTN|nr:NAD(P)H-dependent oxidoreductase [Nonomuraea sp. ATCC 55076]AQZ65405.1 FMN reductase [Nonomuraea sp. ATCC 55076]SPL96734.1 FMN reductase [Actinomadura parvosata subsp. kistnae]